MRTEQMKYLIEINNTHSIQAASRNLHLTPQALSQSIICLEDEIGFQILNRATNGVTFTKQGIELLEASKNFLENLAAIVSPRNMEIEGQLTIHATPSCVETLLAPLIVESYSRFPNIDLKVVPLHHQEIIDQVIDASIPFGILFHASIDGYNIDLPDLEGFSFESLLAGNYVCLAHKNLPIARYKSISCKSLISEPFITFKPAANSIKKVFDHLGIHKELQIAENYSVYKRSLQSGRGVSFAMKANLNQVIFPNIQDMKVIYIKENITCDFGYVFMKEGIKNRIEQFYIDFLVDFYNEYANLT